MKEKGTNEIILDKIDMVRRMPISHPAFSAGKKAFLDGLACGLLGSCQKEIETLRKALKNLYGRNESDEISTPEMAILGGAAIHTLEIDDTHSLSSVHAAGPVMGGVLAAAFGLKGRNFTGKKILESIIVGYEVACRTGAAARGRDPYARGFHPTGVYGAIGAACGISYLLDLSREEIDLALGIAASKASGLMTYLQGGGWTKKLHPGWAANAGVHSAFLASNGFPGPKGVLSGKYNFMDAHTENPDWEKALSDIHEIFEVERMSFKLFGCCRAIHASITAALEIISENKEPFSPEEIEEVEIVIPDEDIFLVAEPQEKKKNPQTPEECQFSIYWGVGVSLCRGRAFLEEFSQEALTDKKVRKILPKISYKIDKKMNELRPEFFPAEVYVKHKSGKTFSKGIKAPKGDAKNPVGKEELGKKAEILLSLTDWPSYKKNIQRISQLENWKETGSLLKVWQQAMLGEKANDWGEFVK